MTGILTSTKKHIPSHGFRLDRRPIDGISCILLLKRTFDSNNNVKEIIYSVFQGFRKAKSANGGSILSSSQFLILPQLPQKIKATSKVVKVN
jgi:hypothetical protein